MLDVLYVGKNHADNPTSSLKEQEDYLYKRMNVHSCLCLTREEKEFIKNLIMSVVCYMDYVLLEEDYNSKTLAQLLFLTVPNKANQSPFVYLLADTVKNEDKSLSDAQVAVLSYYSQKVISKLNTEFILLTLHALQVDCILNPKCSKTVVDLLNLAVLRCDIGRSESIDALLTDILSEKCSVPSFKEFSPHYEALMERRLSQFNSDEKYRQHALLKYNKLPQSVKDKISKLEFSICFSDELMGENWSSRKFGSTHIHGNKVRVWLERSLAIIDMSFYHEMGHVVDYIFSQKGFISKSDKMWETVYKTEKDCYLQEKLSKAPKLRYIYEYSVSSPTEYFAAAFSDYIENPEWLMKAAPKTHRYMAALLK